MNNLGEPLVDGQTPVITWSSSAPGRAPIPRPWYGGGELTKMAADAIVGLRTVLLRGMAASSEISAELAGKGAAANAERNNPAYVFEKRMSNDLSPQAAAHPAR